MVFELKCLDFGTRNYFISYAISTQKCNCYSFLVDNQDHQVLKLSADKVSIDNFQISREFSKTVCCMVYKSLCRKILQCDCTFFPYFRKEEPV